MILKRIAAYLIDCVIIFLYAVLLFSVNYLIYQSLDKSFEPQHPILGHAISFLTLTLPVFLYFFFFESNPTKKGSLGKRLMRIEIANNSRKNIFTRLLFKLLPWELAHLGIHWSTYYYTLNVEIPLWASIVSFTPYILVLIYMVSIIRSKGQTSLYDKIANTKVQHNPKEKENKA